MAFVSGGGVGGAVRFERSARRVRQRRLCPLTAAPTRRSHRWAAAAAAAGDDGDGEGAQSASRAPSAPLPTPLAPPLSDVWEMDFYSRPVIGADGKKLWELIVADKNGNLEHVEAVPNSLVNSRELRARLQQIIEDSPVKPRVMRFFRAQMQNMIKIALSNIDVVVTPSRRTYALFRILEERERDVYPNMIGYQPTSKNPYTTMVSLDFKVPARMPDALRGERYSFVTLQLGQVRELSAEDVGFGELCNIDAAMPDETVIGGICIYTKRDSALAGWLSGSELASMRAMLERRELLMECGLDINYLFARIQPQQQKEAKNFEALKASSDGLHFLAVQTRPDSENVAGFWLLRSVSG